MRVRPVEPTTSAGDHGGHHARHVQVVVADEEGQVGQRQRPGVISAVGKPRSPANSKQASRPMA